MSRPSCTNITPKEGGCKELTFGWERLVTNIAMLRKSRFVFPTSQNCFGIVVFTGIVWCSPSQRSQAPRLENNMTLQRQACKVKVPWFLNIFALTTWGPNSLSWDANGIKSRMVDWQNRISTKYETRPMNIWWSSYKSYMKWDKSKHMRVVDHRHAWSLVGANLRHKYALKLVLFYPLSHFVSMCTKDCRATAWKTIHGSERFLGVHHEWTSSTVISHVLPSCLGKQHVSLSLPAIHSSSFHG